MHACSEVNPIQLSGTYRTPRLNVYTISALAALAALALLNSFQGVTTGSTNSFPVRFAAVHMSLCLYGTASSSRRQV